MSDTLEEIENEGSSTQEVEELDELEKTKRELEVLKDTYARVHADFENIKKRLEREKYSALEYANEKFAKDMLPVADSLMMAVEAANIDADASVIVDKLREGVDLTLKQLLSALEKNGVTPVADDEPFDANVHQAVQTIDSDEHESGAIVNVFQKGYRYKERTLRDAMVVVAN